MPASSQLFLQHFPLVPSDEALAPRLSCCVYEPIGHDGSPTFLYRCGDALRAYALVIRCAVAFLGRHNADPTGQLASYPLWRGHRYRARVYQCQVMHGEHRRPLEIRPFSHERERLGKRVVGRGHPAHELVHAVATALEAPVLAPAAQPDAGDALLKRLNGSDEAVVVCRDIVYFVEVSHGKRLTNLLRK